MRQSCRFGLTGSQPTYEGLKLASVRQSWRFGLTGSQPTYEGLKQFFLWAYGLYSSAFPAYLRGIETFDHCKEEEVKDGSQPTYEGLKLFLWLRPLHWSLAFPAYLRGIETVLF